MSRVLQIALRIVVCASALAVVLAGSARYAAPVHAGAGCNIDETIDAEEQAFLKLINQHRAANGRAPLGLSYTLSRAAAWKSQDLGVNRYFAHDDLDRSWSQRIRDCGYRYNTYLGENIAAGVASAQAAFDLWRNSSGHNANMLGANYTAIGIGRAYVAGSPYGWYWTTEFGGIDDGYAEVAGPEPAQPVPTPAGAGTEDDTTARDLELVARIRGRQVTVTALAADDRGIARVEFWAGGALVETDTASPYDVRVRAMPRRPFTVEARAYDLAGNVTIETLSTGGRRR